MIELEFAKTEMKMVPGSWLKMSEHAMDGWYHRVTICCPDCRNIAKLTGHSIQPNGVVEEIIKCCRDECDFKDHVRLAGWREPELW